MERKARFYYKMPENFFKKIQEGTKTVDARLCDEKGERIKKGDQLVFLKEPDMKEGVRTTVVEVAHFKNFEELAQGINPMVFGLTEMPPAEIAEFYSGFHLRSHIERYGVIAIEFEVEN